MIIYNIKDQISYDNPKALHDTGNNRETINIRPKMGPSDYTVCQFEISDTGTIYQTNVCRSKTIAQNGAQLGYDVMINNIQIRK